MIGSSSKEKKRREETEFVIVEGGKLKWAVNEKSSKGCGWPIFRSQTWQWAWYETVRVSSPLSPGSSKAWQHSKVFNDDKMFRNPNQQRITTYNMVTHGHMELIWSMLSRNLGKRSIYIHPISSLFSGVTYGSSYFHQFQPLRVPLKISLWWLTMR